MEKELTTKNFMTDVIGSDLPVLVDFWASWCGPCRMQAPILENFAKQYDGKVNVFKCNVDENEDLAARFGIMSIPTIMVFKGGEPVYTKAGLHQLEDLVRVTL